MKIFRTKRPDDGKFHNIEVYSSAEEDGKFEVINVGYLVIVHDGLRETDTHIQAEVRENILSAPIKMWTDINSGWVRKIYKGDEVPLDELFDPGQPLNPEIFVRACARMQLATATGGDGSDHVVAAEFLIAIALIMSKLEIMGNRLEGTDAVGPFQLTSGDWKSFLKDNPDSPLDEFQRANYYNQITAAAHILQDLADQMIATVKQAVPDDKDYMPSFLDVLHAWLTSPEAAFAINRERDGDSRNQPIGPLIKANMENEEEFRLATARCSVLMDIADAGNSLDAFVQKTAAELAQKLKTGFNMLKEHARDFLPAQGGSAPWMEFVEQELAAWPDTDSNGDGKPDMTETSPAGIAKTVEYFQSIIPGIPTDQPTPPWCGAFASYCVSKAGETFKDGLPNVPEGSKNWRNWGNTSIPVTADSFPKGAVVMTSGSEESRQIGHVTFYVGHLHGKKKIECIGGNQGRHGRVTKSTFELSRVVAVRWLSTAASAPEDERMVVAMTLYGEARSEPEAGRQGVGSVILNRKAKSKKMYGLTAKDICLKPSQFSCWNTNDPNRAIITNSDNHGTPDFLACLEIADQVVAGTLPDNTRGATHYYADYIPRPSWLKNNPNGPERTAKHGAHMFFRRVDDRD